ncbi:PH domain-containing protein [Aliikangiella sp. IMCC44653]
MQQTETAASPTKIMQHRLSPIAIVFFLVKSITQLIKDAIPAMAPVIVVVFNTENKLLYSGLAITGLLLIIVFNAITQYWFFRYAISEDSIQILEGIFNKKQRSVKFPKIQNINIIHPFYYKPFKLVILKLETAGSSGDEINLAGITLAKANQLKAQILSIKQANATNQATKTDQVAEAFSSNDETLASASLKDIIKYGLSTANFAIFAAFTAPLWGSFERIIEKFIGKAAVDQLTAQLGGGAVAFGLMILGILLTVFIVTILFSVIGAILRFYQFKLTFKENTFKRSSGLFSTHEESAKQSRIQAVIQKTNFLGHLFSIENLILKQVSLQGSKQDPASSQFIIPARSQQQSAELTNLVLESQTQQIETHPIHPNYIKKMTIVYSLIFSMPIVFAALETTLMLLLFIVPITLGLGLIFWQRWRKFSFGFDQEYGLFNKGFWGFFRITFALHKVQHIKLLQSPLMRRKDLCHLKIYLASGSFTIPYLTRQQAVAFIDQISFKIETTTRGWY